MIYSDVIAQYKIDAQEERAVANAVITALGRDFPGNIVDLGSGPGVVLKNLRLAGYAGRFTAVDIEPQKIAETSDTEFVQCNAINWQPPAGADYHVALLSHVLSDIAPAVRTQLVLRLISLCKTGVLVATNRMDSLFGRFLLSLWQHTDGFNHYLDWPTLAQQDKIAIVDRVDFSVTAQVQREAFARCAQLFTPNSIAPEEASEIIQRFWPHGSLLAIEIPQSLYVLRPTNKSTRVRTGDSGPNGLLIDPREVW